MMRACGMGRSASASCRSAKHQNAVVLDRAASPSPSGTIETSNVSLLTSRVISALAGMYSVLLGRRCRLARVDAPRQNRKELATCLIMPDRSGGGFLGGRSAAASSFVPLQGSVVILPIQCSGLLQALLWWQHHSRSCPGGPCDAGVVFR